MKDEKENRRAFMDTYRKIRKPMPPAERVIRNDKDVQKEKKFDWRRELEQAYDSDEDET